MRRSVFVLLAVPLFACGFEPETEEVGEGSYEFHAPGSVQSRFADPAKTYHARRSIRLLQDLGAITPLEAEVATRVDGIIANKPADGWVSVEELVTAEQADKWPAFFDDEQATFPALWSLMAAPDGKGPDMALPPALTATDRSTAAGEPAAPVVAITALPAEWQTAVRRLEKLHDDDDDDTTVSLADVLAGIAKPGAFTTAELDALRKTEQWLRDRATNTPGRALVRVPEPGTSDHVLFDDRGVRITVHRTTTLEGTRRAESYPMGSPIQPEIPILTSIQAVADEVVEIENKAGGTLIVTTSKGQYCRYDGTVRLGPQSGALCAEGTPVALEIWRGGKRVDGAFAKLRGVSTAKRPVDLSAYADHDVELEDGTPLSLNITKTRSGYGGGVLGAAYDFVYEKVAKSYAGVDPAVVAKIAPATFALPAARYRTSYGSEVFTVEVREPGVVYGGVNGKWERMTPAVTTDGRKLWGIVPKPGYGAPGHYARRPYLFADGKVYLTAGFPVLTEANRI